MTQIPPHFIPALVALERRQDNGTFKAVASGVLVGLNMGTTNDEGQALYRIALFTARHVVGDLDELWAKFNRGNSAARFRLELKDAQGNLIWRGHPDPDYDVVAIPINHEVLQNEGAEYSFVPEEQMFKVADMYGKGLSAGDDIYVLGFPMGLAGVDKLYSIVRGGTLARLDDKIVRLEKSFIVDCFVFPGNSGGPVVNRGSIASVTGTPSVMEAGIIGIVSGYIPYQDYAVSNQTGRLRVMFEENSGLVKVVPVDAMLAAAQPLRPQAGAEVDAAQTVSAEDLEEEAPEQQSPSQGADEGGAERPAGE